MKIYLPPTLNKAFTSDKRYVLIKGGRGSGKSYSTAAYLVGQALKSKKRILCVKETQNSLADSALATLKRVIEAHNLTPYFTFTKYGLEAKNGSLFLFKGMTPDPERLKSIENIDILWAEEAQSLSEHAIRVIRPTVRKEGSRVIFTYNPLTDDDPVAQLEDHPNATTVILNYYDNPFLSKEMLQEAENDKHKDYDMYLHIWEGEPLTISDSLIFKGKYKVEYFDRPEGVPLYAGLDFGVNDPTAATLTFIHENKLYIEKEVYLTGQDAELENIANTLISTDIEFYNQKLFADSAWPQSIMDLKKRGFNIRPVKKHKVLDGINFLKSFDKIVIHPRCEHTLYEFSHYSWKTDKRTNKPYPEPEDKWNHEIDNIRYGLSEVFRSGVNNKLTSDQMYQLARALR